MPSVMKTPTPKPINALLVSIFVFINGVMTFKAMDGIRSGLVKREDEYGFGWIGVEGENVLVVHTNQAKELFVGAVPGSQPDDFWRMPVEQAPLLEVRILSDDGEPIDPGVIPDVLVREPEQAALSNVRASREHG